MKLSYTQETTLYQRPGFQSLQKDSLLPSRPIIVFSFLLPLFHPFLNCTPPPSPPPSHLLPTSHLDPAIVSSIPWWPVLTSTCSPWLQAKVQGSFMFSLAGQGPSMISSNHLKSCKSNDSKKKRRQHSQNVILRNIIPPNFSSVLFLLTLPILCLPSRNFPFFYIYGNVCPIGEFLVTVFTYFMSMHRIHTTVNVFLVPNKYNIFYTFFSFVFILHLGYSHWR